MDEKKLSERVAEDRITADVQRVGWNEDRTRRTWNVTLFRDGKEFRLPDVVEQRTRPDVIDVLDLLLGVCGTVDQCESRDEWAREYTSDGDPEHKTYTDQNFRTWQRINNRLLRLLGVERHREYLYNTDRSDA